MKILDSVYTYILIISLGLGLSIQKVLKNNYHFTKKKYFYYVYKPNLT